MWRSRSVNSNEQRFTSRPPDDGAGVGAHNLDYHSDVTITGVADEDLLVYDSSTGQWINASLSDLTDTHPIAAHAEADGTHSLTAAADNTWQVVPWSTSLISSVTVCPLSFYTAGGSLFTVPEDGYYDAELTIALAADPDLFGATLEFGLFVNNTLVRTFYCSSNDWSLSYAGVLEELSANDTVEIKFRRSGAGYATAVDLSSRSNFSLHKIAAVGFGGATAHALNAHTDTNFPSPTNGQAITWNSGTSRWVATTLTSPAHTFGSHSDANANLTSPGAGLDQYVVVWDNASTSFKLVVNPALGSHALDGHTDTNLGSPGAPEDGYVVAWDNGAGEYVLVAPTAPGAHTLDSHSNVTITAAAANHKLRWNGSAWVNVLDNLDSLSDVVITVAAAGDVLYFDGTNWVDYPIATLLAAHNHTLDSLSNVSTTGKAVGDFLWWTGSAWEDRAIRINDLFDVVSTAPSSGQALAWDGSNWVPTTITAAAPQGKYLFAYSASSGFVSGSGNGASLNTGFTPNRFIVSVAGIWMITVSCSTSASPGDLVISTSVGGSSGATTYTNSCVAALGVGGYFTISGPNPVGSNYSVTLVKIGEI